MSETRKNVTQQAAVLFVKRGTALLVDALLATTFYVVTLWVLFGVERFSTVDGTYHVSVPAVLYAVYWLGMWLWCGTTPGMFLFGLRVVDVETNDPPVRWQWWVRGLGFLVAAAPAGFGFLWALWDPDGRAWHDHIANTMVIDQSV